MGKLYYNNNRITRGANPLENLQTSEIPTPGPSYIGKIYQYTGETLPGGFENGLFYRCVIDERDRYIWEPAPFQSEGIDAYEKFELAPRQFNLVSGRDYDAWCQDGNIVYIHFHIHDVEYTAREFILGNIPSKFRIQNINNMTRAWGIANGNIMARISPSVNAGDILVLDFTGSLSYWTLTDFEGLVYYRIR